MPDDVDHTEYLDDDEGWYGDVQALADAMEQLLGERGPLALDEIAQQLGESAPELLVAVDTEDLPALLRDITYEFDGFWPVGDRFAASGIVLDRSWFTHQLSAAEAERGAVALDGDLEILGSTRGLSLPGGGLLEMVYGAGPTGRTDLGELRGPPGWLDGFAAGDIVAFCQGTDTISMTKVERASLEAGAERLVGYARRAIAESSARPETFEFVLDIACAYSDAFTEPTLPLSEILPAAGIERRGAWLGPAGETWSTPGEQGRERRFAEALAAPALEDCCRQATRQAFTAFVDWDGTRTIERAEALKVVDALRHAAAEEILWAVAAEHGFGADAEKLGVWASAMSAAIGDRPCAPLDFLRGVCADRAWRGAKAEALLERALSDDAQHFASLLCLAEFAEDRGDAKRSAALQARAGLPASEYAELDAFLAVGRDTGRNDPCPCGSGRKFKVCCLRNPVPVSLMLRAHWLLGKAERFAAAIMPGELQGLLIQAGLREEEPDPRQGIVIDLLLFERPGLARYLVTRGELFPADERELANSWVSAPMRLLTVAAIDPDVSLDVVDVRAGDRFEVSDKVASKVFTVGESFLARVLPVGEQWMFSTGVVPIAAEGVDALAALLETASPSEVTVELVRLSVADDDDDEFDFDDDEFDLDDTDEDD